MNEKEFQFILQEGEGLKIEFKESFDAKHLAKEVVALANTSGGRIFLGVTDKGEVNGVVITNKLKSEIQDMVRNCEPSIKISLETIKFKGKEILVVIVPEGENKPYLCSGGFFLRQGANSQKLTREEIFDFAISEGKVKFDTQLNPKFIFPNDFDEEKFIHYLKLAKIKEIISIKDMLINMGLAQEISGKLIFNNAGILFFGKNPGQFFLSSKVVCVNYQSNEKLTILDRKIFDLGFLRNLDEAINYVKMHIDTEFVIKTVRRLEIPQYPEEAFRECIVNAMMHRDYFDTAEDVLIEIFRNKIIISNPGGLVKGLNPEEFGRKSRTRNGIIANLLARTFYVEKLGTGINRIKEALAKMSLPAPLFKYNSSFQVTLFDKKGDVGVNVADVGVNIGVEALLEHIQFHPGQRVIQLAQVFGVTTRTIERWIRELKNESRIEFKGSPKRGGYYAKNEKD